MNEWCSDCGGPIGMDSGPIDGWELEDGRVVCQECCVSDLRKLAEIATELVDALDSKSHSLL